MRKKSLRLCFEVLTDFRYLPFLTLIFKTFRTVDSNALTQILVEAFNNAVIHGHHRAKTKWIKIDLQITPKATRIRVMDSGGGLKGDALNKIKSPWKTSGRGLQLIQANADKVSSKCEKDIHTFEVVRYHV